MDQVRVAVAGAGGFIGVNLRRFFSKNKVGVVALTRRKQKFLKTEKGVIYSDLDDPNIVPKLAGCAALVDLIGSGRQTITAPYETTNVLQTKKIINLCQKAKIKKIVYISGLGVSRTTTSAYFISKLKAEELIVRSGLDYTILRASYIVGKNDPLSRNLKKQAKRGYITIAGSGKYKIQPISIYDVLQVISKCISSRKLEKKIVDLVGPRKITFEAYARQFSKKIKKIPAEDAIKKALDKPKGATYGLDDLLIMFGSFTSNHRRLERLCGFKLSKDLQPS